jgi:hypothetical protein
MKNKTTKFRKERKTNYKAYIKNNRKLRQNPTTQGTKATTKNQKRQTLSHMIKSTHQPRDFQQAIIKSINLPANNDI